VLSPLAIVKDEVREKKASLQRLRLVGANALGVLLGEGLSQDSNDDDTLDIASSHASFEVLREKWQKSAVKSIGLMQAILTAAGDPELVADQFDDAIVSPTVPESLSMILQSGGADKPDREISVPEAIDGLLDILDHKYPRYTNSFNIVAQQNSRPSLIVRYWLPATFVLISSSTILRIITNRKEAIIVWMEEFGRTVIDFWSNWVVEPIRKVVGTIRHDEGSEISIMSKRSLEGDRDSLERMVVDFAIDNRTGSNLTPDEVAEVRSKVKEGDLTPVLKAYEKDLKSPLLGAVRGDLIRALLIQIQKTKVDVEVAIGGIDSLLKSQELVFGFVGLTPGVLVCVFTARWLSGLLRDRKSNRSGRKHGELIRLLRNVDRILTAAQPTDHGELFYKDHGLLLCEAHVLRQCAAKAFPHRIFHEFLDELDEVVDVRVGLERQRRVVSRMRWAYAKWLN
jgi:nuclear-control-of-ATPase protein 2